MTQPLRKKKSFHKFLTICELNKLNTKRLLGVLKSVRAIESATQKKLAYPYSDEYDGFYLGQEAWKEYVLNPTKHLTAYKNRIKKILSTRENVK